MIHKAKPTEEVLIYSMGKRFRVEAIATTDDEANALMKKDDRLAVIACFGPFVLLADKYPATDAN